ncbi:hypothetical protein DUNSADRAFT_12861 [Dunaliella salina]|uniref:Uncharacterized protein n=1 Tax=Dunaliella salina TaxID=3046 RepID=A0ABQ7H9R7_DUNSA|nr:hypothetical protein DUNSADRAFT_12861 [Dunaliella salina]|eukprot:KAF5843599.1 hypothetical protein DUNSADRAFT_12861 [Dunaliella salina]
MPDVKARLSSVETLGLESCALDNVDATLLSSLFPKLGTLTIGNCSHSYPFFELLASKISLKRLSIFRYNPFVAQDIIDVCSLACLRDLKELNLEGKFEPSNLPCLLPSLPLHRLTLDSHVLLHIGMQYASRTLQTIVIDSLSLQSPTLEPSDFPCLSVFDFRGINFSAGVQSWADDQEIVGKFRQLVSWVSKLPCPVAQRADRLILEGNTKMSTQLCTSLLSTLAPLQSFLSSFPDIEIFGWCFDDEGLLALCELTGGGFEGFKDSDAETCVEFYYVYFSNNTGLVQMLSALPFMDVLKMHDVIQVPKDALAALLAAQRASRPFCLKVHVDEEFPDYTDIDAMRNLSEQWQGIAANISGPQYAELELQWNHID